MLGANQGGVIMKTFLQVLLALGLLAFIIGAIEGVTGGSFLFTPEGYWRGATGFWILLIATKLVYWEKQ